MSKFGLRVGVAALAIGLGGHCGAAMAQDVSNDSKGVQPEGGPDRANANEASSSQGNEILVTARRREETSLEVPVTVAAFSGAELTRAGVSSINDIARLTPQLKTFSNIGVLGGFSAIRGITSPSGNAATDPAVLVVVNNIPVGTGGAMLLGQFDLGQAEILKGPQALYFGKNATAGIISLTTAEPTDELEGMVRGEYEFEARQVLTEGFISGPLSDSLRGRIAVKYANQDGEFRNGDPASKVRRGLDDKEIGVRGTLIFEPSSDFSMKLKGTYNRISNSGPFLTMQRVYCPNGAPAGLTVTPAETDCKLDNRFFRSDLPLNLGTTTGDALFPNDGIPYYKNRQWLFSLETTARLMDGVQLTSNTGYYKQDAASADNAGLGGSLLLASYANDQ